VLTLEVVAAALALGLLAFYLAILGRGALVVLIAAGLVCMLLLVTFDLDRPTRGLIDVPSTPLDNVRASMSLPPAEIRMPNRGQMKIRTIHRPWLRPRDPCDG
jgi:hypothetical protein